MLETVALLVRGRCTAKAVGVARWTARRRMCSEGKAVVEEGRSGQVLKPRGDIPGDISTERVVLQHDQYERKRPWGNYARVLIQGLATVGLLCYMGDVAHRTMYGYGILQDPKEAHKVLLTNRWGTETILLKPKDVLVPENENDVIELVKAADAKYHALRCVGASLSANLLAAPKKYLVNMKNLAGVVEVDKQNQLVTVQSGASLGKLLDVLKEEGMTLRSIPSHRAATVGGIVSTGSHGSSPKVGPIDSDVVGMTLVTPKYGVIQLPSEEHPSLFTFAKISLGLFGVITEVVLRCTERFKVEEHIQLASFSQVRENHRKWLLESESLVYLWFPDGGNDLQAVVIRRQRTNARAAEKSNVSEREALKPMRELMGMDHDGDEANPTLEQLRSALYEYGPKHLKEWTQAVNSAELAYWRNKQGLHRVGWNDEIMKVADYGPNHVADFCVPVQRQADDRVGSDLEFVASLYRVLKEEKARMNPPIVQTFSASSSSAMSPAVDENPQRIFSWVELRIHASSEADSTTRGNFPMDSVRNVISDMLREYEAAENLSTCTSRMFSRYDTVKSFRQFRYEVDPNRTFSSNFLDNLFVDMDRESLEHERERFRAAQGQALV